MTDVQEAGARWIERHLRERWPGEQRWDEAAHYQRAEDSIKALAENLDAIASQYEVPVEMLIEWLYLSGEEQLSTEAFRVWAERYAAEREKVLQQARGGL